MRISKILPALLVFLLITLSLIFFAPPREQNIRAYLSSGTPAMTYDFIQHPLPTGSSEPWAIDTSPSGAVWFVEQGSNQLGMLDTSNGNITEYQIPTPNSTAISVAVDGTGNVWFTELTSNRLGELKNGSSNIVEYKVPGAPYQIGGEIQYQSCGPTGAVPHSGSIWLICEFSNQIDEFFPQNGTFASFDLPIYMSGPAGLAFDDLGNFYFTAADANMLGQGVISALGNGTSNGITEFAPINQTYSYTFEHASGPLGPYYNLTSSLPTPSGIAITQDGKTIWVTEHVDSSFDSYDIGSKSLDRYWTSKTNGAFGYHFSFPNGIAIDGQGNVWISEHYGNKIAEFQPSTDSLTEYIVPCCESGSAGTYTLTLGQDGVVWFVEIAGNAIGELKPVLANGTFSLSLGSSNAGLGPSGSVDVPVSISTSGTSENISLGISGISSTGELDGASATFSPENLELPPQGNATSTLTISNEGLSSGSYYLTVSATVLPRGVIYSQILKLSVTNYIGLATYAIVIGAVGSVIVIGAVTFMMRRRRRFMSSRRRTRR